MERDADAITAGAGGRLRNEAAASVLRSNANDVRNGGGDSRIIRAMIAFAQQPEGWRLVPKICPEVWLDRARRLLGADAGEAQIVWSAMLDVAPIPGEE
jgi:hypothetical protein